MDNQGIAPQTNREESPSSDPNTRQRLASDPLSTVWVGASAGTGKTKILTDRVLRLMLPKPGQGIETATPPEKIVCITFTKAAAAEMALRIHTMLSKWAVMPDMELSKALSNLTDENPDSDMIRVARRLFAHVVDTAGGMKIMTIHSFCQSVLSRFPIEAELSPHFEVMDERTAQDYLAQCQSQMIKTVQSEHDTDLARAFTHLTHLLNAEQMEGLLKELTSNRSRLSYLLTHEGGYQGVVQKIYTALGCDVNDTRQTLLKQFHRGQEAHVRSLRAACEALSHGSKTDQTLLLNMLPWMENTDETQYNAHFKTYTKAFLTAKYDIRKKLGTKQAQKHMSDIGDVLYAEAERVLATRNKLQALNVAKMTAEVLRIGAHILELYKECKDQHALLDYDDLIYYTRDLLREKTDTAWVLFKLDGGIDHVLIDEAQDTNPEQWQVISALTEEFFSGHGRDDALDKLRTLFVVGDEKQSIFSFQRADPAEFARMQSHFATCVQDAEREWRKIDLEFSFRSTPEVLDFVDTLFGKDNVKHGVVSNHNTNIQHVPYRKEQPGLVELWPVVTTPETEMSSETGWTLPLTIRQSEDASMRLADKIAETIRGWLDTGEMLTAKARPIEPRDIMILVRTRNVFVEQCVRALKSYNIPVSGVDRMVLNEQIAVMDLIAAAQFSLLADDDLTLATLLKTPLIGLNDDDLFALCHGREDGVSVWQSLQAHESYNHIVPYLMQSMDKAVTLSPYRFFAELLNQPCPNSDISGRHAILSRLGYDALDPLEELLNTCFQYSQQRSMSLQGFLDWFAQGKTEVKREQEQNDTNQIRIMTVHGSKGLQAPIVFMPDTLSRSKDNNANKDRLLWHKRISSFQPLPLWAPREAAEDPIYKACSSARAQKEEDEYKRLLYVALTRAEDRLYICGHQKRADGKVHDDSWYGFVHAAMRPLAKEYDFDVKGEKILEDKDGLPLAALRLEHGYPPPPIQEQDKAEPAQKDTRRAKHQTVPDWCRRFAPTDPTPSKPLAPSRPADQEPASRSPLQQQEDDRRFQRGLLIHKLLEIIPSLHNETQRETAMRSFLSRPVHQLSEQEQETIFNEVQNVLQHAEFAPIFGAGSEAEVPFHGRVKNKYDESSFFAVSGIIDRLLVTDTDIYVIDYKTNRPPPTVETNVPDVYLKQMAMYGATLRHIYPDKTIHCALLWTDGPFLMPLSDDMLAQYYAI